jgi:hypothetical protein
MAMKSRNLIMIFSVGILFACSSSSDPVIEQFLAEWIVEAPPHAFRLTSRTNSYPDALVGDRAITPVFSDGSFITTSGGRDYPGYIIFRVLSPDNESSFVRIYDTDRDFLPDRVEYSNGDVFIGRTVVTDEGFNIEFRKLSRGSQ